MSEVSIKGLNFGGWLVLEKWMTPELFNGREVKDEFSLSSIPGGAGLIDRHRRTFITEEDFRWVAKHGFDCIRLPVGYWVFGGEAPFNGCIEFVDFAFDQAEQNGLNILIDLHGLPGSQNGHDHSGRAGEARWHQDKSNLDKSLSVVKKLAERYGGRKSLYGVEVINEPNADIPHELLLKYYDMAYQTIREACGPEVVVVFSDAWRSLDWQNDFSGYSNIYLDCHLYQVFSPEDKELDLSGHIRKANNDWGRLIEKINHPMLIGEWSGGIDLKQKDIVKFGKEECIKRYVQTQFKTFQKTAGSFFWNYKVNDPRMLGWSLKDLVDQYSLELV